MTVPHNKEPLIELANVAFSYGDAPVLEDISFSIYEGEYVGIIGPNGGGKTTLLKIILGLLKPESGSLSVPPKAQIGYVPQRVVQNIAHFPATVEELVESGRTGRLGLFHRTKKSDKNEVKKALEIADVSRLKNRLIGNLSGGERQRVFIARALAGEPKVLILDEPYTGIDIAAQEKFYTFVEKLNREFGITILFVSHDMDIIAQTVNRCLCINRRIVCYGKPEDMLKGESLEKLYGKHLTHFQHKH